MNIFTKTILIIMLSGITHSIFAQQPMHVRHQKVDIPFYEGNAIRANFLNRQTISDTIWLPAAVNFFWNGILSERYIYEYHEDGLLKKLTTYNIYTGEEKLVGSIDYNNIYSNPLVDIPDTIFNNGYIHPITGEYQPPYRYYYNNRQADSSFWEEYYQEWDEAQWSAAQKTIYAHLMDTVTVSEFQDYAETYDGHGGITYGHKAFLIFDEQGNVIEALTEIYDAYNKKYRTARKDVYLYDDEGRCHTREQYIPISSDTWRLDAKHANMKWFEFHGFYDGHVLFFGYPAGDIFYDPPLKHKNKLSYNEFWGLDGSSLVLGSIDSIKWEIEPFSCHRNSYSEEKCIKLREYKDYNEHGHVTAEGLLGYDKYWIIPCASELIQYVVDDYINTYNGQGLRYEYIWNNAWYPPFPGDTIDHITMTYIVDSFTYVGNVGLYELPLDKHTLLIVPNPANETVRITATDSIDSITFYASDGRLAYSQEGSGKEIIVNLHGLSQGIYLVQARLKDGGVQTGKIIKN